MNSIHQSARLLRALSHPVRLELLGLLDEDEECVCHLTAMTARRQAYISQHLGALRRAGIVLVRKEGLRVYYRLGNPRVRALLRALSTPRVKRHPIRGCECPKCDQ